MWRELLEEKLARVPVPDAGARAEELLVKLRRPQGMSMATWCATVRESYRKLQRALKRARPSSQAPTSPGREDGEESMVPSPSTLGRTRQPPVTPTPDGSPGTSPSRSKKGSKATVAEPEQMPTPERPSASATGDPLQAGQDDDEGREELVEDPETGVTSFQRGYEKGKGKRYGTSPSQSRKRKAEDGSSSSSDETTSWRLKMWQDMDSGLPEVLPTELLGWLMLRRCSLSPQQRLNVLSATGNSLQAEDVEQALRGAEDELRVQESEARGKGKGRAYVRPNFWIEQDGEW